MRHNLIKLDSPLVEITRPTKRNRNSPFCPVSLRLLFILG